MADPMTAPASPPDLEALERLPDDGQIVYVPGGVAYHVAGTWYSLTGFAWPGQPITWDVTWWLPLNALPALIAAARERDVAEALSRTEQELTAERQRAEQAEQRLEAERREWWRRRDVDVPCEKCHGAGSLIYANTSTWRGGIGGNAMRRDVCDRCWGSGEQGQPWMSHREAAREREALERRAEQAEQREARLKRAITRHRVDVWGSGPIDHDSDRELYAALAEGQDG